jgi:hypothetical protein
MVLLCECSPHKIKFLVHILRQCAVEFIQMIDIEKALIDPGLVFKTPEDVFQSKDLSHEQKIKILCWWEYDVRELEVAEEEGMKGAKSVTLDLVRHALRSLGAHTDMEHSAPTKQGGS